MAAFFHNQISINILLAFVRLLTKTVLKSGHLRNRRINDLKGRILNVQVVMKKESMVISRCCFAENGMEFFKGIIRIARLFFLRPIKFLIYGVAFAVPFVFA